MAKAAINTVLNQAKKDVGVSEEPPGSNRGKRVEQMLKNTGLGGGHPWCAAAVATWGLEAIGATWPLPRAAACDTLLDFAERKGILRSLPLAGDVFLIMQSPTDAIHTGLVLEVIGNEIKTIEGNTNAGGSAEGYMVKERTRTQKSSIKYIRWIDLVDDVTPSGPWTVQVGQKTLAANAFDGTVYTPLRSLLEMFFPKATVNTNLGWSDVGPTWLKEPFPFLCPLKEGKALAPVRDFAKWQKLKVSTNGNVMLLSRN